MKQSIRIPAVEQEWLYAPDMVYQTVNGVERKLQIIFPYRRHWPEDLRLPVVINIPGSAWYRQEMYNGILNHSSLARRGFILVDVQYRESTIAKYPAQVEDVRTALAFLPQIAEQFHMDMGHVFLMGDSSGAHIALMTTLTTAYPFRGVVSYYAPSDLTKLHPDGPAGNLLACWDQAAEASCARYISTGRSLPPMLLFHGTEDPLVNVEHSRQLHQLLTESGHDAAYYELEGASHGGGTWWSEPVMDIVEAFIRKQMA